MTFTKRLKGRGVRLWASRATRRQDPRFVRLGLEALEDRTLLTLDLSAATPWLAQGPGPINKAQTAAVPNDAVGAVESLAVWQPKGSSANIVYAGTVNGGVWRTDNLAPNPSGATTPHWTALTDFAPSLSISSLALDPTDPSGNTLWVGTGPLSSSLPHNDLSAQARGLLRLQTTDGGNTWTQLVLGQDLQGTRILSVVPTSLNDPGTGQQVVLVAGLDGLGVQRSTNGGNTFTPVLAAPAATDLVVDPNNNQQFWAAVPGQGIFVSADGGATWSPFNNGLSGISGSKAIKLAVAASGSTTLLYAAVAGGPNDFLTGVFQAQISSAGAGQWAPVGTAPHLPTNLDLGIGHFALAVDPFLPTDVFVSGYGGDVPSDIFEFNTQNPAAGWQSLFDLGPTGSEPHTDSRHLAFLNDGNLLLDADDGGVYSLALGTTQPWVSVNGDLQDTEFYSIAFDPLNHVILGGTQDNANPLQMSPGSDAWKRLGAGDGGNVAVGSDPKGAAYYYFNNGVPQITHGDSPDGDPLLLANQPGGARFSGLVGGDDVHLEQFVAKGADVAQPFTIAVNPANPQELLFGSTRDTLSHLYESFDEGTTVNPVDIVAPLGNYVPTAFAYGINDPDDAYMATSSGDLLFSSAGSTTGELLSFELLAAPPWAGQATVTQIAVDPYDVGTAYFLVKSSPTDPGQIWQRSAAPPNSGHEVSDRERILHTGPPSWTNLTNGLPLAVIDCIDLVYYPPLSSLASPTVILLAAGRNGVYRYDPSSFPTWSRVGAQLPNVEVTSLQFVPPDPNAPNFSDLLVAGTFGRGAFLLASSPRAVIAQGDTLLINGLSGRAVNAQIVVQADPDNRQFLQILVNGDLEYDGTSAGFKFVTINGADDTLTMNFGNGNPFPNGVAFNGGTGHNTLAFENGSFQTEVETPSSPTAGTAVFDGTTFTYTNMSTVDDTTPVSQSATFNATGAGEAVNVVDGGTVNGLQATQLNSGADGTFATVNFANKAGVTVNGVAGPDTVTVNNPHPAAGLTTLNLVLGTPVGAGTNTADLHGLPPGVTSISVQGAGNTTLEAPGGIADTWTITGPGRGTLDGIVSFSGITNEQGGGTDRFEFEPGGSVPGYVDGGPGPGLATLDYSALTGPVTVNLQAATASAIGGTFSNINDFVGSASPGDTLIGDATWDINGPSSGSVNGLTFTSFENLVGGGVADQFIFLPGGSISGNIDGGGGSNTLDYSALAGPVAVNLQSSTATGLGGNFSNLNDFVGSAGSGTLTGPNSASTWDINGPNSGSVNGLTFASFEDLGGGGLPKTDLPSCRAGASPATSTAAAAAIPSTIPRWPGPSRSISRPTRRRGSAAPSATSQASSAAPPATRWSAPTAGRPGTSPAPTPAA